VLRETPEQLTLIYGHGLLTMSRDMVESVTRSSSQGSDPQPGRGPARVPSWEMSIRKLAAEPWGTQLQQVPATVISAGAMRNVPYKSFHCGRDYELNVYGDPDAPSGIELGLVHGTAATSEAQARCVAFMSNLLADPVD